jgi:hypothetical protein
MRKFLILFAFMTVHGDAAQAAGKVSQWIGWYPSQTAWNEYSDYNPYLENGTDAHTLWHDTWTPEIWVQQRQDGQALVKGFIQADIIREHGVDEKIGVPVVTVGPNFYRLGGREKQRVIAALSAVNRYAGSGSNNVVMVRDWYSMMDIGVFTANGLTLH